MPSLDAPSFVVYHFLCLFAMLQCITSVTVYDVKKSKEWSAMIVELVLNYGMFVSLFL